MLTNGLISPRYQPAVVSISETQILIMGGIGNDNNLLGDILLFDINTKSVTTEVEEGLFKFSAPEN